jgi:RNA polymerase sigma-70 factor, ECF subfamily
VRVEARDAYERVFREVAPGLWRALFVFAAGRRDIADDAVAEAFARALERADSVREPRPWLYRTAFRIARAELRRTADPIDGLDGQASPESGGLGELTGALRRLSPSQRAAIVLHYEEDLPVREVARFMGSTAGAVRVHLHAGRRRLREMLGAEEVEDD